MGTLSTTFNPENGETNSKSNSPDLPEWHLVSFYDQSRHKERIQGMRQIAQAWRMKERMKTVSVALVLCLNVGVDPPDIVKTQPCAKLECWTDPMSISPQKALECIGSNLQKQYERWQPRARYKQTLDPTVDEVKKLCTSLRRNAKEERVLFHYNGHGVPKPTVNGEIWVFNKSFTQYIPLSIYDLQTWMGAPSIYVYDCSNAATIIDSFIQFAAQHEQEYEQLSSQNRTQYTQQYGPPPSFRNCVQLAACAANQILPMNPELPADLFTSCLTTPITVALRWFVLGKTVKLVNGINLDIIDKLPGQLNDRRTMLGELNWIFTAVTDTIAWNTLPRDLFQKLFRQDLLVASLFRNFLLAERIMRSYNCHPVSHPKLPPTYQHPMWHAWDLAMDMCLSQLATLNSSGDNFQPSPFFAEQLTAFQVWLSFGSAKRLPPEQLPIVLQVLLSQVHRLRALDLLGQFLDLGPWAVNLALSVGIFPYVLKLLQSSARELRPLLVFIWAKILAVDSSCQTDLVRDNGHKYFLTVLEDNRMPSDHRTMAAFVLASIVSCYPSGQEAALQANLISTCLEQLNDTNATLRQWLVICLSQVWTNYEAARWCGVRDSAHEKLYCLLTDGVPEVRASAVQALGTFMSSVTERNDHANTIDHSVAMTLVNTCLHDGSHLVRQELVCALQWIVLMFEGAFVALVFQSMEETERRMNTKDGPPTLHTLPAGWKPHQLNVYSGGHSMVSTSSDSQDSSDSSVDCMAERIRRVNSSSAIGGGPGGHGVYVGVVYVKVWQAMNVLSTDPHPEVAAMALAVIGYIKNKTQTTIYPKEVHEAKTASYSAPSSPSNKPVFLGESPPANINSMGLQKLDGLLHPEGRKSSSSAGSNTTPTKPHGSSFTRPRRGPTANSVASSLSSQHSRPSHDGESDGDTSSHYKTALVTTDFIAWCCKYFAQSVMKMPTESDPQSKVRYEKEWKYLRNQKVRLEALEEQKRIFSAGAPKLDEQLFIHKCSYVPANIRLHPYEPLLIVTDRDTCGIWDWEQATKSAHFSNRNPKSTRITSVDVINPNTNSLLVLASDDGAVRLWRNCFQSNGKEPELATSWIALSDMIPAPRGSGTVFQWQQQSGYLFLTGDVRIIRLWDMNTELKLHDIPTGVEGCVTCLSLSDVDKHLVVAGFSDGTVSVFDHRLNPSDCRVISFREHSGWVVNAFHHKRPESDFKILSGSVHGEVKFWDVRQCGSVRTCIMSQAMTSMDLHHDAHILACGSANQYISIHSTNGEQLNLIRYHDGFMGHRIGQVSCVSFHDHRVWLASGTTDSFVSVYSLDRRK